jgi:hypothetical protein
MQSYRVQAQKAVLTIYDVEDGKIEAKNYDSFVCNHCQWVTFVKPKCDPADMGGLCWGCSKLICAKCATKQVCSPWEKQMELMEARDRLYQAAHCY